MKIELTHLQIAKIVQGMSVTIDVSTGDDASWHRPFGTVDEIQNDPVSKRGPNLYVHSTEPNFVKGNLDAGAIRNAALEEAAKICESPIALYRAAIVGFTEQEKHLVKELVQELAYQIRSLKSKGSTT